MNNRLLHIGMPKSGSTYLQRRLFGYAEEARVVSQFTSEDKLCKLLIECADAWIQSYLDSSHHIIGEEIIQSEWDTQSINMELSNLGGIDLILSSEYLLGNDRFLNMDLSEQLWDDLSRIVDPTLVLVLIRRQDNFMKSLYLNHYRQNSWRMSFDYFLSVINSHAVDYYQLYLKLIAIFPKDNVLFLPAELLFSDERRFIDILSNRSGIVFSPIENEVDSEKIKFQNIAMSSLSQRVLGLSSLLQRHEIFVTENQVLGRLHQSYNSFFVNFTRWLDQQLFGTRLYKKIEIQSAEVLSMYMESNGKLNKLIQEVDLCEFGYC